MKPKWQCVSYNPFTPRVRCQQATGHESNHFNDYYALEWEDGLQLTFDDPPAQRHSRTSREAAERIKDHAPSIRERVYKLIAYAGPISDQQIAVTLGLAENTVRPRRVELVAEGLVRAHYKTVLTASRRQATAWVVT